MSREACAEVARGLGVVERLRAHAPEGVGKNADVLIGSDRILASVCEAIKLLTVGQAADYVAAHAPETAT